METFSGHTEEGAEDILGRKNSKIKSLKSRLFSRGKRADVEETAKLSQSASDITAGKGPGPDEDLLRSTGTMGSRALSHDSIFLSEVSADPEPTRILSQDNVHSKIKALQMKLQLQKMHLGPPPMVLPVGCPEEPSSRSEDCLLWSSEDTPEEALQETLTETTSRPASSFFSPGLKPPTSSHPSSLSVPQSPSASTVEAPLDFSTPVQLSTRLDTSAARHRMSIKPRNQRASTKKKPSTESPSGAHLSTLNSIDLPESVRDRDQEPDPPEAEMEKTDEGGDVPPPRPPLQSSLDTEPKPQPDRAPPGAVPSQLLRAKPRERPHSSFIESEPRERREVEFGRQVMFLDKKQTPDKSEEKATCPEQLPNASNTPTGLRSSSAQLWPPVEAQSTAGIMRPAPGTGSFRFSISAVKTRDKERPRSTSFAGVLEQTEARQKPAGGADEKRGKEEPASWQVRGRPRQGTEPSRTSAPAEPATPSKPASKGTGAADAEEPGSSQEPAEEAEEAKEAQPGEGKTTFGVILRATSQSLKYRSETSSNRHSRRLEDQGDKWKRQDTSSSISRTSEKLASVLQPADPAPPGIAPPAKHNAPPSESSPATQTDVQRISSTHKETPSSTPQEPQPAPQTSSSEVSWMSLAMEKTRSLQQLFASRFPRDFTGSARTPVHVHPPAQPEATAATQTPTEKSPPGPAEAAREESTQSRSPAPTVKPSSVAAQQKMAAAASPVQSTPAKESQTSKPARGDPSRPASHPGLQTNPWTSLSPLRSSSQPAATSSPAQALSVPQPCVSLVSHVSSSQQKQPSWTSRGLQTKSTPSPLTPPAPAASTSDSTSERGERAASIQRETPSVRRAMWTGSVGERAELLEKRAEWTSSPSLKEMDVKKSPTETQTSCDSSSPVKASPLGREADVRPGFGPAESNPSKVPERPPEDRWLRKTVGSHPSPSSSPTQPSVLQSLSESGQPSWMELAKRKSMAWSDKTMD